ncbi:MAG: TRAP transporter substrate-binding protein [Eubacteriales bacterium]
MKKSIVLLLCLVMVVSIFAGCSSTPSSTNADEKISLKIAHIGDVGNPYYDVAELFKKKVEEKSNGSIEIVIYPNQQLGGDREIIEAMQFGNLDLGIPTTSVVTNFEPQWGVLDLPYVFTDWEHMHKFADSDVAKSLLHESEDESLIGLGIMARGLRHLTNNIQPIETVEDLKGLKMRVIESPVFVETFKAFGANATAMAWGEVYTALQQGTIDGIDNTADIIKLTNMPEVQKYMSLSGHMAGFAVIMASKTTWDTLTPEQQEILSQCGYDAAIEQGILNEQNENKTLEELGKVMEINDVEDKSAFEEKVTFIQDDFMKENGSDYFDKIKVLK